MCLTEPARVVQVSAGGGEAVVELRGAHRRLSVALLTLEGRPVKVGTWVLASAGMAVEQIDETEARELLALLQEPKTEEEW
jgi:hydrogenase assembly chaperone HypC/HupF